MAIVKNLINFVSQYVRIIMEKEKSVENIWIIKIKYLLI
jgi:hypothetical protein